MGYRPMSRIAACSCLLLLSTAYRISPKKEVAALAAAYGKGVKERTADLLAGADAITSDADLVALHSKATTVQTEQSSEVLLRTDANATESQSTLADLDSAIPYEGVLATIGLAPSRGLLSLFNAVFPSPAVKKVLALNGRSQSLLGSVESLRKIAPQESALGNFLTNLPTKIAILIVLALGAGIMVLLRVQYSISCRTMKDADDVDSNDNYTRDAPQSITVEILWFALPLTVTAFFATTANTISLFCLGQAGLKLETAAFGLVGSWYTATIVTFGTGICSVLDVLGSQAWGSGSDAHTIVSMQRTRFLSVLQLVWIIPLLWFSEPILLFLKQDKEVAALSTVYCRILIPVGFFAFNQYAVAGFLRNRGDIMPTVWSLFIGIIVHAISCPILVNVLGMGLTGVSIAQLVHVIVTFCYSHGYLLWFSDVKDYPPYTLLCVEREALNHIKTFLNLACPFLIVTITETWYWEINTLIIGSLATTVFGVEVGNNALAAHTAAKNIMSLCTFPFSGLATAITMVAGHATGLEMPHRARQIGFIWTAVVIASWTIISLILVGGRNPITLAYSKDPEVQRIIAALIELIVVSGFFGAYHSIVRSALKGIANPWYIAMMDCICYYLVGLVSSCIMVFGFRLGVYGVYAGFVLGAFAEFLWCSFIITTIDFEDRVAAAFERVRKDTMALSQSMKSTDLRRSKSLDSMSPSTRRSMSSLNLPNFNTEK